MDKEVEAPVRRRAAVFQHGELAGHLEAAEGAGWTFSYIDGYDGAAVSLTLPVRAEPYRFDGFPAVFEGLLPEGPQLEALLRKHKIDRVDAFRQLVTVGADLVGSLTVHEITNAED
ncbi:MAG: toxin HipA [Akkermansiaceae bacterium]|nr:toxin HipA [Akkermansiaceae bacterium]